MHGSSRSAVAARPLPKRTTVEPAVGAARHGRLVRSRRGGTGMKRFALLLVAPAAALIMLLPATAGAATFKGVVIAKDSARKSLVTASGNGIVRTVRLTAGFKRTRVGGSVVVRGSKLPDGTFSAAAVKELGKSRGTHVRGTVVRRLGAQLIISAGGSVFALRLSGKRGATDGGLKPGDRVDCHVRFKHGTPQTNQGDIDELGHDGQLVLEGIYLSADDEARSSSRWSTAAASSCTCPRTSRHPPSRPA